MLDQFTEKFLRGPNRQELKTLPHCVSDDLRGLRSLKWCSRILAEKCGDCLDLTPRDYTDELRTRCLEMSGMSGGLVQPTRAVPAPMNLEGMSLCALVQKITRDLSMPKPKRYPRFEIEEGIRVIGDSGLLKTALGNMEESACDPPETRSDALHRSGREKPQGKPQALLIGGNEIRFDMSYSCKPFASFGRLNAVRDFFGLGSEPAPTARFLQRHGGRIWAEALPATGAVVYFTPPKEPKNEIKAVPRRKQKPHGKRQWE